MGTLVDSCFQLRHRFPLRAQVELANNERLEALEGDELTYYARDFPGYDMFQNELTEGQASKLLDNGLAPRLLRLRVGAQVMLTKVRKTQTYMQSFDRKIEHAPGDWARKWLHWDCRRLLPS